jgi:hypothetical protein
LEIEGGKFSSSRSGIAVAQWQWQWIRNIPIPISRLGNLFDGIPSIPDPLHRLSKNIFNTTRGRKFQFLSAYIFTYSHGIEGNSSSSTKMYRYIILL